MTKGKGTSTSAYVLDDLCAISCRVADTVMEGLWDGEALGTDKGHKMTTNDMAASFVVLRLLVVQGSFLSWVILSLRCWFCSIYVSLLSTLDLFVLVLLLCSFVCVIFCLFWVILFLFAVVLWLVVLLLCDNFVCLCSNLSFLHLFLIVFAPACLSL